MSTAPAGEAFSPKLVRNRYSISVFFQATRRQEEKTMKRFAEMLLVTLGFGALGFVMSLVPQKNATGASAAPVNIVSSIPLSVSGTVAAQQSGTWNVGISGTPSVNAAVSNPLGGTGPTPLVIQDSENPARTAFDPTPGSCSFNGSQECAIALFVVPTEKIAVIESASGICGTDSGASIYSAAISFGTSIPFSVFYFLPGPAVPVGAGFKTTFSQNLRAYAFGGTNPLGSGISFVADATGSNSGGCFFSISGHFVTP
jgi:hypothetical protein